MEGIWSLQLSTLPLAAILSSKASGDAVGKKFLHDFQFVFQYPPTTLLILNDREGKQVHGIYLKTPYIIIFRFEQNIPKVLVLTRLVLEDTELPIKIPSVNNHQNLVTSSQFWEISFCNLFWGIIHISRAVSTLVNWPKLAQTSPPSPSITASESAKLLWVIAHPWKTFAVITTIEIKIFPDNKIVTPGHRLETF